MQGEPDRADRWAAMPCLQEREHGREWSKTRCAEGVRRQTTNTVPIAEAATSRRIRARIEHSSIASFASNPPKTRKSAA